MIFLDRFLHRLRPVAVASLVSGYLRRDFARNESALAAAPDVFWGVAEPRGEPALVVRSETRGAIQAVDVRGLVGWARKHQSLLVVRRSMGDFVPTAATLLEIYGGDGIDARDEVQLRDMIALGAERTIEQDPGFAIRIMVDIADKALSAAINDPTTAVQVLDHLSDVLRLIGTIDLSAARVEPRARRPSAGVVIPVRRWEDYLVLATTEIRELRGALDPGDAADARDAARAPRRGPPAPPARGRGGAGAAGCDRRPRVRRLDRHRPGKRR